MKKNLSISVASAITLVAAVTYNIRADNMPEIKFELGHEIRETAKSSGAPKYTTSNVAGTVSYEIVDAPKDVAFLYQRRGYEIRSMPLFAFTLWAEKERNLLVDSAALQFWTDHIKSHVSAKTFIEELISQFQRGKWKRYVDEFCPAVTGRSSYLNAAGEPERIGYCALDPSYRLGMDDWVKMMGMSQRYQWIGEDVLATLDVGYSNDIRGITYKINLAFDDFTVKRRREEENLAKELAEGDANGWNSSDKHKKDRLDRKAMIKLLEENARKRGDSVIPR